MKSQRIYLSRHGVRPIQLPAWAPPCTEPFDADDPDLGLAPLGHEQAVALAERMIGKPLEHIFCSPFRRTIESALPLARQSGIPIKIEWGLSEWLKESWFSSLPALPTAVERQREFPEVDADYQSQIAVSYPETQEEVWQRTAATVQLLMRDYGSNIFLMGHGAAGCGIHNAILGSSDDFSVNFCSLWEFERAPNGWMLTADDGLAHLKAKGIHVPEL